MSIREKICAEPFRTTKENRKDFLALFLNGGLTNSSVRAILSGRK